LQVVVETYNDDGDFSIPRSTPREVRHTCCLRVCFVASLRVCYMLVCFVASLLYACLLYACRLYACLLYA
jgi:hypothetical protein